MGDRYAAAGNSEVFFVAVIADPAAPTSTEINAGIDLVHFLADNGLDSPFDGSTIDTGDLGSRFNKTAPGTYGGQPLKLDGYRGKTIDTFWDTLPRDTAGYIVTSRGGTATRGVFAIGDVVEVWPIEVISRNRVALARNAADRAIIECSVPEEPTEDFALVA